MVVAKQARIRLLNGFTVHMDGMGVSGDVGGWPKTLQGWPRTLQRLVAHVCLSRRPGRSAVAGTLWPVATEELAHGSLRSALCRLHKLAPGLIEVSDGGVALGPGVRVDVKEMGDWARRILDPRTATDDVEAPDPDFDGELLPGWYDDWVVLERERLRQLRLHALEMVSERLAARGRYGEALQAALGAVRMEPLRESAHRAVVRIHLAEGNLVEAATAYERFRTLVLEELGVAPTPQMAQLLRDLPSAYGRAGRDGRR